jgi:hypothetical protein
MSRQPHEIANINLRIRETLRARLEREAKRHQFSLNNEIRIRLEDSFNRDATRVLDDIANDMQINWLRYSNRFLLLDLGEQLSNAVAAGDMPKAESLARLWLRHREQERRLLTEGRAS